MNTFAIPQSELGEARRYPHSIEGYTAYQLPCGKVADQLKCQLHILFDKFPYVEEPLSEEDVEDILDNFWYSPVFLLNEQGEGYVSLACWFTDLEDLKRYAQYYLSDVERETIAPMRAQVVKIT